MKIYVQPTPKITKKKKKRKTNTSCDRDDGDQSAAFHVDYVHPSNARILESIHMIVLWILIRLLN